MNLMKCALAYENVCHSKSMPATLKTGFLLGALRFLRGILIVFPLTDITDKYL